MVLVASLTIPASAVSWTVLSPVDYISDTYYEGNIRNVVFDFDRTPYIQCYYNGRSLSSYGSIRWVDTDGVGPAARLSVFPLGAYSAGGPPLSNSSSGAIAIDITDCRPNAALTLSSKFAVQLDLNYDAYDQYIDETFVVSGYWSFQTYSESGSYLGTVSSSQFSEFIRLQDVDENYTFHLPLDLNLIVSELPTTRVYLVPILSVNLALVEDAANIVVNYAEFLCYDFTISTQTDMLLEESLTLRAIDGKLGDLNDKADTIINGTQEQQEAGQNALDKAEEQEREFDEIMDQLEEYEKIDSGSVSAVIQEFVYSNGWLYVKDLLSPLLDWGPTATIMLIVLALVNISVILFGR